MIGFQTIVFDDKILLNCMSNEHLLSYYELVYPLS